MAGIKWAESPLGNPLIVDNLHWLDCEIHAEYTVGDHLIVIGEVKALKVQAETAKQPLLYYKGQYCQMAALNRPNSHRLSPVPA